MDHNNRHYRFTWFSFVLGLLAGFVLCATWHSEQAAEHERIRQEHEQRVNDWINRALHEMQQREADT